MSYERMGVKLDYLVVRQSVWSQKAFGTDQERGPKGALEHLKLEAQECIDAPDDLVEYADCFLLLIDALRRAGFTIEQLLDAAIDKQKICETREWDVESAGPDDAIRRKE